MRSLIAGLGQAGTFRLIVIGLDARIRPPMRPT